MELYNYTGAEDRQYFIKTLDKIARPVLDALSKDVFTLPCPLSSAQAATVNHQHTLKPSHTLTGIPLAKAGERRYARGIALRIYQWRSPQSMPPRPASPTT